MSAQSSSTQSNSNFVERADALNFVACARLVRAIDSHATACRSWAGIALTRLHSANPVNEGTATMLLDIAAAMEAEANVCAGLARKLKLEAVKGKSERLSLPYSPL